MGTRQGHMDFYSLVIAVVVIIVVVFITSVSKEHLPLIYNSGTKLMLTPYTQSLPVYWFLKYVIIS